LGAICANEERGKQMRPQNTVFLKNLRVKRQSKVKKKNPNSLGKILKINIS